MAESKCCSKCGEAKSLSAFYLADHKAGRYGPRCRTCISLASKANRAHHTAVGRAWRERHPEKVKTYRSSWNTKVLAIRKWNPAVKERRRIEARKRHHSRRESVMLELARRTLSHAAGLAMKDVPGDLVEAKALQLRVWREAIGRKGFGATLTAAGEEQ